MFVKKKILGGSLSALCLSEVTVHSAAYRTVPVLVEEGIRKKERSDQIRSAEGGGRILSLEGVSEVKERERSREVVKRRKRRGYRLS